MKKSIIIPVTVLILFVAVVLVGVHKIQQSRISIATLVHDPQKSDHQTIQNGSEYNEFYVKGECEFLVEVRIQTGHEKGYITLEKGNHYAAYIQVVIDGAIAEYSPKLLEVACSD